MNKRIMRTFEQIYDSSLYIIAILFVLTEGLYLLGYLPPNMWRFESAILIFIFLLVFGPLIKDHLKKKHYGKFSWDFFMMLTGVSAGIYLIFEIPRLEWYYGSVWTSWDIVFGLLLIIGLLEISRKKFGLALPLIAVGFLIYTLFGHLLPKQFFGHTGFGFERTISFMFGPGAIFGIVFKTFVKIIFVYMLFGTFLTNTGVGRFFVDLSFALAGKWRGGPAKVAVIASAVLGTINGNSVANTATTGAITIPLMKRTGYKPHFAGAVEASASAGGQILPPIMGAAAFIMAEFLQIPYREVIIAAFLPALLYFSGIFFMVDLEAVKTNLKGIVEVPSLKEVLKSGFILFTPIIFLVYALLIQNMSIMKAGLLAIASCIVVSWLTKDNKMGVRKIADSMVEGARDSVGIGAICASAGIVIGAVSMTGLGNQFSSVLISLAGDNILIIALFTAIISIVLGMGLPTTAAYIISMSVAVPALVGAGVAPLSAHLFVFYFAVVSAITPPVGAAFYTGAAIAEASVMKTGINSMRIGIGAYSIPFFFIQNPVLLMDGSLLQIISTILTSLIGIGCVTMSMQKCTFWGTRLYLWQSLLLFSAFIFLVHPALSTDLIGFLLIVVALLFGSGGIIKRNKEKATVNSNLPKANEVIEK